MRFFLLDHFSRHPWGCVEALKPFLGPFFPRKLLINMLVTLIGENSASESNAECNDSFKGRRGRPCLTLLDTIRSDLKRRKISNSLRSISDFENLRVIALDRVKWKSFEKM